MTNYVEEVTDVRGTLVKMGLGKPSNRAVCGGIIAAGVLLLAKFPEAAFREDGSMRPFKPLSAEPDATYTHFLLGPIAIATACYLFT